MNNKEVAKEIEDILKQTYLKEECRVDSLMNMEKDCVQCKGCSFLLFAEKDGSCNICSHALDIDLDEVV